MHIASNQLPWLLLSGWSWPPPQFSALHAPPLSMPSLLKGSHQLRNDKATRIAMGLWVWPYNTPSPRIIIICPPPTFEDVPTPTMLTPEQAPTILYACYVTLLQAFCCVTSYWHTQYYTCHMHTLYKYIIIISLTAFSWRSRQRNIWSFCKKTPTKNKKTHHNEQIYLANAKKYPPLHATLKDFLSCSEREVFLKNRRLWKSIITSFDGPSSMMWIDDVFWSSSQLRSALHA